MHTSVGVQTLVSDVRRVFSFFVYAVSSFFVTTVPVPLLSATVMRMRIATTTMLFGKPSFVEVEQGVPEETLHENETKQVICLLIGSLCFVAVTRNCRNLYRHF